NDPHRGQKSGGERDERHRKEQRLRTPWSVDGRSAAGEVRGQTERSNHQCASEIERSGALAAEQEIAPQEMPGERKMVLEKIGERSLSADAHQPREVNVLPFIPSLTMGEAHPTDPREYQRQEKYAVAAHGQNVR